MAFGDILAHILIALSIAIMGAAIERGHKLYGIIKRSKAEKVWKPNIILLYLLIILYIVIMITRIFIQDDPSSVLDTTEHYILMDTAFLVASFIIFRMVSLEIDVFTSFFNLLEEDAEEDTL